VLLVAALRRGFDCTCTIREGHDEETRDEDKFKYCENKSIIDKIIWKKRS